MHPSYTEGVHGCTCSYLCPSPKPRGAFLCLPPGLPTHRGAQPDMHMAGVQNQLVIMRPGQRLDDPVYLRCRPVRAVEVSSKPGQVIAAGAPSDSFVDLARPIPAADRKSTRLNSSHVAISY